MDKLNNIIGLTSVDNYACWSSSNEGAEWAAKNASLSGYFVGVGEYAPDFSQVKDVGDKLTEARTEALRDVCMKVRASVSKYAHLNVDSAIDKIGKPEKSTYKVRNRTGSKLGFRFKANRFSKGVSMHLRKASLKLDTAGTYTVRIHRIFPNVEEIEVFTIEVTEGSISYSNQLDRKIPLYYEQEKAEYVAFWERTGNEKPYNVESTCGCGDDPNWFRHNLLSVEGVTFSEFDELPNTPKRDKSTNGLHFDIELTCDALGWMDSVPVSFWTQNHIGTTFAKVVQLDATKKLINKLLDNNGPNAYNILDREGLMKNTFKINNINKGLIAWLGLHIADNTAVASRTDCFYCKTPGNISMSELDI